MNKKRIIKFAKKYYAQDDDAHDYGHISRVLKNAKIIHKKEGGDWNTIFLAVMFHDVHRIMSNKLKHYVPPEESLDTIAKMMDELEIENSYIEKVLPIIKEHEKKKEKSNCIELTILKDADIIDSLGKTGVNRTVRYCINRKIPFFNNSYALDDKTYVPNTNPISTCHYIYNTLLANIDYIVTETGKSLAKKKSKPLRMFLKHYYPNLEI